MKLIWETLFGVPNLSWIEWVKFRFVLVVFGHDKRNPYWQILLDFAHLEQRGRAWLQMALESASLEYVSNVLTQNNTMDSTFTSPALICRHCRQMTLLPMLRDIVKHQQKSCHVFSFECALHGWEVMGRNVFLITNTHLSFRFERFGNFFVSW